MELDIDVTLSLTVRIKARVRTLPDTRLVRRYILRAISPNAIHPLDWTV